MASGQHKRLEQLFNAALRKGSPAERAAFLEDACGDDPLLRDSVEELLRAHDQAGSFLNTPVVDLDATVESSSATETPGTKIGRYKILQLIGEGGFGSVYMAEQEEPVRRKVALKIIKLGMDTRQVIARFEAERQALALMDHPNIAKVLDAAATSTGRPYFVMELVKGISITEYCNRNRFSAQQRLQLFLPVCHAVQHAHQKGIIHRDIKPNNVLVTLHDGQPVPQVIDFGIAKATSQRLTEKTLFTEFRQFIGTPQYMSPDQAEISGLDVDTRTDIYSLGVLLYELLTGTTPFPAETLQKASYVEIQRIIREVEPDKPSTRVATLATTRGDIGLPHGTEVGALSRLIRGDLDWIVMKAMEKDRTRRYATAHDLASDIERHLNHEPVLAGAPGVTYKLGKFFRRHRVGVSAGLLIAAALLSGLSLATAGFVQANRARGALQIERDSAETSRANEQMHREAAEENARAARKEAAKFAAVTQFVQDMLSSVDPSRALGREITVREVLDRAAERIHLGSLGNQPEIEAAVRMTVGRTYKALGLYDAAEVHVRAAEAARRRKLGDEHPDTLQSCSMVAGILAERNRLAQAEKMFREVIAAQQRILGEEHPDTLRSMNGLGITLWRQGKNVEAEKVHRVVLEAQRRELGEEHVDTLRSVVNLATALMGQYKLAEAEALFRQALETELRVLGERHPQTMVAMNNLGLALEKQGRLEDAEVLYRRALELDYRVLGRDHPGTQIPLNNVLRVLRAQDHWEETRPYVTELIAHHRRAAEAPDADAITLNAYAWLLLTCEPTDLRDATAAIPIAERAVELDGERDPNLLDTLAVAYAMTGDLDRAVEVQKRAVALPGADLALYERLAKFLWQKGDLVALGSEYATRLAERLAIPPEADSAAGAALAMRGQALLDQGDFEEAEQVLRPCWIARQDALPAGHWLTADTMSLLGAAIAGQHRFAEGEALLLEAYMTMRKDRRAPDERVEQSLARIVGLYELWGKTDQAARWRRSVEEDARSPSSQPSDTP